LTYTLEGIQVKNKLSP